MKAEQRKELETNALADRMGHLMQRMKTQPRRSTMYYVVGMIAVVVVFALAIRWLQVSRQSDSERWYKLYNQTGPMLQNLAQAEGDTNAGKAAKFEFAWRIFWEGGIKRIGVGNATEAMDNLDSAAGLYRKLAEECSGDPLWEPEALYGLAVIEETHAVENLDALDRAKVLYENLAKNHKESARGKLAAQWLENYETPRGKQELQNIYQELHTSLGVIDRNFLKKLQQDLGKKKPGEPAKGK